MYLKEPSTRCTAFGERNARGRRAKKGKVSWNRGAIQSRKRNGRKNERERKAFGYLFASEKKRRTGDERGGIKCPLVSKARERRWFCRFMAKRTGDGKRFPFLLAVILRNCPPK